MKTIWKFTLHIADGLQKVQMPSQSIIVSVHMANEPKDVCFWAVVESINPPVTRSFYVMGTGHLLPTSAVSYIGTAHDPEHGAVWHILEQG